MKKIASFLGIVFALTAFAGTQTSKEYVDKKDAEVFERAKTFTEEHVGNFENWARTEIVKKRNLDDFELHNAKWHYEEVEAVFPLPEGSRFDVTILDIPYDFYWRAKLELDKVDRYGNRLQLGLSREFNSREEASACKEFVIATSMLYSYLVGKRIWYEDMDYLAKKSETVPVTRKVNGQPLTQDITVEGMTDNATVLTNGNLKTKSGTAITADNVGAVPTSRTVNGKSLSDDITLSASDVGAADGEQVQQLQAVVTTYTAFVDGSNVVFSITNYLSGAYVLNEAKFKILELKDDGYHEVYNSRTEILLHVTNETQKIVGFVNAATNAMSGTISGKADKAWGKYTSAGGEAPSNTVYMTAPNTVFAGGMEYERVAVGEGAICVLTTKGAPVYTQGDEGTFKFQDDGGTNYFGFAKSDSYTQGCRTDRITVQNQMVTLHYDITMSGVPCIWYKEDLTSSEPWEQLNLPDRSAVPGATHQVQWEENPDPGTQECHIDVNGEPKGFFKATIEVAGSAKFMSNMPADLSGGIFCTDGQHKVGIDWNNGSPRLVEVQ